MAGAREQSKPTFLWQALLILLPVIVLASIGWMSLRRDKMLARQEAASRAQALADELVPRLWSEIITKDSGGSNQISFQVDAAGWLLLPPPYHPLPVPNPLDLKQLNAEQKRLWFAVQEADRPDVPARVRQACKDFLDTNPPADFAASACYGAGLTLARQRSFLEAMELYGLILDKFPTASSESGIPFSTLARFQLVELRPRPSTEPDPIIQKLGPAKPVRNVPGELDLPALPVKYTVSMEEFCSNIVTFPNAMTPVFFQLFQERMNEEDAILAKDADGNGSPDGKFTLENTTDNDLVRFQGLSRQAKTAMFKEERATIQKWQRIWDEHESARRLYSTARENFRTNAALFPLALPAVEVGPLSPDASGVLTNGLTAHLFWFNAPDWKPLPVSIGIHTNIQIAERKWLGVRFDPSPDDYWFVCRDEFEIASWLTSVIKRTRAVPDYFGIAFEVAGRKIQALSPDIQQWHYQQKAGGKAGGGFGKVYGENSSSLLASSAQFEKGVEQLKVNVYLTSPSALFQDQRSRAVWFGSLMAVSTAAALIGLFMAHRAFRRQLRLNEMKSNFVSSVSHELRAPIASVRLMAESLERGTVQEPGKQHEYFRFIVQECRRLSSLIENVLDFSRIEQGRKQYEFEPTDLTVLTRRTVALMETYAAEHQVRLEVILPDFPASASVDGKAIQQALVNLIDNAVKHSAGGSSVRVGLEAGADSVQLWVEDKGEGIPIEEQEKIFERFYRLGSELRRETPGVGIGLSIVKHIVEAHDGNIIVRSSPGEGSRFTIELPNENETSSI